MKSESGFSVAIASQPFLFAKTELLIQELLPDVKEVSKKVVNILVWLPNTAHYLE